MALNSVRVGRCQLELPARLRSLQYTLAASWLTPVVASDLIQHNPASQKTLLLHCKAAVHCALLHT